MAAASDLSPSLRNALYNLVARHTPLAPPAALFLALFSSGTDELTAGGYHRQAVAMGAPTDGAGVNTAQALFGPLDGDGTATHAAFFAVAAGGKPLTLIRPLAATRNWQDGGSIFFATGDIHLQIS